MIALNGSLTEASAALQASEQREADWRVRHEAAVDSWEAAQDRANAAAEQVAAVQLRLDASEGSTTALTQQLEDASGRLASATQAVALQQRASLIEKAQIRDMACRVVAEEARADAAEARVATAVAAGEDIADDLMSQLEAANTLALTAEGLAHTAEARAAAAEESARGLTAQLAAADARADAAEAALSGVRSELAATRRVSGSLRHGLQQPRAGRRLRRRPWRSRPPSSGPPKAVKLESRRSSSARAWWRKVQSTRPVSTSTQRGLGWRTLKRTWMPSTRALCRCEWLLW